MERAECIGAELSDQELGADAHMNGVMANGTDSESSIAERAWLVFVGFAALCATLGMAAWTSLWRPPDVLWRLQSTSSPASHLEPARHPPSAMYAPSIIPQPPNPPFVPAASPKPHHPIHHSFQSPLFPGCKPGRYPPGLLNELPNNPYEATPLASAPHAILAIFSGRADRMRVLVGYVDALKQAGRIQEVHLWDRGGGSDSGWLEEISRSRGYRLFPMLAGYRTIYRFYASLKIPGIAKNRVVIVKCDDDVVFVDQNHFTAYVNYTAHRQDLLLVQANVVNNGVAGWYQFHRNPLNTSYLAPHMDAYPPGGLFGPIMGRLNATTDRAYALHALFLKNPSAFHWSDPENGDCIVFRPPGWCVQARFSVNVFAARLAAWPLLAKLVYQEGNGDDENAITTIASEMGHRQCMYTPFNAVHLAFNGQWMNLQLLPEYVRFAQKQGLALPDDPAPWCEGIVRGDVVQSDLEVKDNIDMPACKARCRADGRCAGVVYLKRGCGTMSWEWLPLGVRSTCRLKEIILPLTAPGSGCHCTLVKGSHFS